MIDLYKIINEDADLMKFVNARMKLQDEYAKEVKIPFKKWDDQTRRNFEKMAATKTLSVDDFRKWSKLHETVADIDDLIKIMRDDPYTPTDPYMQGLANGLICAQATAEDRPLGDNELISHEHSDECDCEDKDMEEAKKLDPINYIKHLDISGKYEGNDKWYTIINMVAKKFKIGKIEAENLVNDDYLTKLEHKMTHGKPLEEGWKTGVTAAALAGSMLASPIQGAAKTTVDAGHGGTDPGAVHGQKYERDIVKEYAADLRRLLPGSKLSRDGDVKATMRQRAGTANAQKSDVLVSFHANSTPDVATSASGVRVLCNQDSEPSTTLANQLAAKLEGSVKPIGPTDRGWTLLDATSMPAVIIELGFMNNPADLKLMQSPEFRSGVVAKVAEVLRGLGYEKEIRNESAPLLYTGRGDSVYGTMVSGLTEAIHGDVNEANDAYEVTINGLTQNLPKQYAFTHASSEAEAMRNVISKIATDFGSRGWAFKDNKFSAIISPKNIGVIIKHLNTNMNLWKARKLEANSNG